MVGGDSQKLGKNMMESFGLARGTSFSGWQPHHIIPTQMQAHPVIQKIGMNLDHPTNGIMLPEPDTASALGVNLPTHEGFHSIFNNAIRAELDAMDINLPARVLELKVFGLQQRAREAILRGMPLYKGQGASVPGWRAVLKP